MSIKFEDVVLPSAEQWEAIIIGTRNPLNSWEKSDSGVCPDNCNDCDSYSVCGNSWDRGYDYTIGKNDLNLMKRLCKAGTDHRKFMRMISVMVTITAPLYWWKEFDTYKVGTVANSCSTMHKIHAKEFTLEDFSCEHLIISDTGTFIPTSNGNHITVSPQEILERFIIPSLNHSRTEYLETKDKKYWWQMIQLLPSSYNQKRTVMLNYEVLANIYKSRKNHKLDEWSIGFINWIKSLPYYELITGEFKEEE